MKKIILTISLILFASYTSADCLTSIDEDIDVLMSADVPDTGQIEKLKEVQSFVEDILTSDINRMTWLQRELKLFKSLILKNARSTQNIRAWFYKENREIDLSFICRYSSKSLKSIINSYVFDNLRECQKKKWRKFDTINQWVYANSVHKKYFNSTMSLDNVLDFKVDDSDINEPRLFVLVKKDTLVEVAKELGTKLDHIKITFKEDLESLL